MAENYPDTLRTKTYMGNVELALAEMPGKFVPLSNNTAINDENEIEITDRFSELYYEDIETRNGKTVNTDPDVERRWLRAGKRAGVAPLIDPDDRMSTKVDQKAPVVMGTARGARRYHDDKWLVGFFGTAWTGEEGKTATPFKAANVLAADFGETGGVYKGLTLKKLRGIRKLARKRFVDTETEKLHMIVTAEEIDDLLSLDQFINGDYSNTKALENGEVRDWMGFRFIPGEIDNPKAYKRGSALAVNGSGHRRLPVWVPSGMHYNTWLEFEGHTDVRSDMNHSEQIAGYAKGAGTRTDEDKCFIVECGDVE